MLARCTSFTKHSKSKSGNGNIQEKNADDNAARYLVERSIITSTEVDRELAEISISYLCFRQISQNLPEAQLNTEVMAGTYAFYEYAVSQWTNHLLEWLPHSRPEDVLKINECLESLLDFHFTKSSQAQSLSKSMEAKLSPLESLDCYYSLAQFIVWTRKVQLGHNSRTGEELSDFPRITALIRSTMERLFETDTSKEGIVKYYGQSVFKCPHMSCHYFTEGFQNRTDRDEHIERHERAYMCLFDGCPMATIGFASKKDFEKHLKEYHDVGGDQDAFPDLYEEFQLRQRQPSTFHCTLCPKRFTRAYSLRSHLRTHTDERPFVCTVCGKAFARQNDRKRHEGLHSGEKKFVCRGDLKAGSQWGCGTRFARAEALGRHFRSEPGRVCIKPLLDEEMKERQDAWEQQRLSAITRNQEPELMGAVLNNSMSMSSEKDGGIPDALLEQYPALGGVDWNSLQAPEPSGAPFIERAPNHEQVQEQSFPITPEQYNGSASPFPAFQNGPPPPTS